MAATAKRESGVEHDIGGAGVGRLLPAWADPEFFTKLHCRKIVHPAAFPRLIFDFFYLEASSVDDRRVTTKPAEQFAKLCVFFEECAQDKAIPQRGAVEFFLKDRLVFCVEIGDRYGACGKQLWLDKIDVLGDYLDLQLLPVHAGLIVV